MKKKNVLLAVAGLATLVALAAKMRQNHALKRHLFDIGRMVTSWRS